MKRAAISLDDQLAQDFYALAREERYASRCEAVRDLAQRLSEAGHRHHGLVVSTTHVHLDEAL